jgi:gamma-glutamyltranspeptidase
MQIKPGDHVPDDMAPLIVMKADKPVMAVAAVGVSLVPETVRIILGTLGNHAAASALLAAPPLLYNYEAPTSGESYIWKKQFLPAGAYDSHFLEKLRSIGVQVQEVDHGRVLALRGTAAFVTWDESSRMWQSAEAPETIDFGDAY